LTAVAEAGVMEPFTSVPGVSVQLSVVVALALAWSAASKRSA
jgi:hypothetical protein